MTTQSKSITKSVAAHTATAPAAKKAPKPKKSPAVNPTPMRSALDLGNAKAKMPRAGKKSAVYKEVMGLLDGEAPSSSTPVVPTTAPAKVLAKFKKPKKAALISVKLELTIPQSQIREVVECAASGLAEECGLKTFPVKLDDLVRNKAVIAALTKAARYELTALIGDLEETDDVLDDVSDALRAAYTKELHDAEDAEKIRAAAETTQLTVKRAKMGQIQRLLRDKGLL